MDITLSQEKLDFALANVSRLANSRTSLPILSNILLRTDGSTLVVAATNLEVAAQHRIGVKIAKHGSITIPAKLISDFVHNLPKDKVHIVEKNSQLHISSAGYSSIINTSTDEDFPELPVIDQKNAVSYTIATNEFKAAVSQTIVAASSDTTRPVLTGVYWHSFEGSLYCAATDGYRLAEKRMIKTTSEVSAIIPVSTLQEVLRTLRDDTTEVNVIFNDTQVSFVFDGVEVTSRLVDGNFPDYRQLIPSKSETSFTLSSSEFNRVTKMAGLFARESGGGITISTDSEKGVVLVHSIASEVGENTSEIQTTTSGDDGSVSLNSRYLIDALSAVEGSEITFGFSGKLAPCVVSSTQKNSDYKHIIMPLKS